MYDSFKAAKYNEFCSRPKEYSWHADPMTDTMIQDGDQIVESKGNDQELKEQEVLLYDEVIKFAYARTKDKEAAFDIGQNVMEPLFLKQRDCARQIR